MVGEFQDKEESLYSKFMKKLESNITFDLNVAKRYSNLSYSKAQAKNQKMLMFIESEKARLSTPNWEKITAMLDYYRNKGENETSSLGRVLLGVYNRNKDGIMSNNPIMNTNLMSILGKPEILMIAYKEIKKNKGALTMGAEISKEIFNSMSEEQKTLYLKSISFPDGITLHDFEVIAALIRKNKYPWGSSLRIYIDKPGNPAKKRPLTIPPFMDRVVQKAIELILQSIYEPLFERTNKSFGFRPNKGTHDAMFALLNKDSNGMRTAIEGDIESAYDTVDKDVLIKILSKRIKDKKFLSLIRQRVDYNLFDTSTKEYSEPSLGIPQGGIDSPYLFNIYMHELDEFVQTDLQGLVDRMNSRISQRKVNKTFYQLKNNRAKLVRLLNERKKELSKKPSDKNDPSVKECREKVFDLVKKIRLNNHKKNRVSSSTNNSRILRIRYVRYADDWILLTNGDKGVATVFKQRISGFLEKELKLKLSPEKTLITNITKDPAKFLGFQLKISARGAIMRKPVGSETSKQRFQLYKRSGLLLWAAPDAQRMINRLHMKGFCTRTGYPITVPWISTIESHAIVERYNAIIRGLGEYYLPVIRNRAEIQRWIYILRYSCLKTLAQKYKGSISKIFKRFGFNMTSRGNQTISIAVRVTFREVNYLKRWTLLTYKDLVKNEKYVKKKKELLKTFWDRENGVIGEYPLQQGNSPKVTNEGFLDSFSWVSWRTMAALDMPCAFCGCETNVEMHHIKHIRKRAYALIPDSESYQRILALRNRKQVPLCRACHNQVHTGQYSGPLLKKLIPPVKLMDNRIIQVESFVKPGREYHAKSLLEKGWCPTD